MEVDGTTVRTRKGGFGQRVMVLWKRKRFLYGYNDSDESH